MGLNDMTVPFVGKSLKDVRQEWWDALQQPEYQRKLVLVTVSIALLLDNMLYMVIVPIIPDYLRYIGAWNTHETSTPGQVQEVIKYYANSTGNYSITYINKTSKINVNGILIEYEGEDSGIGLLFASKAAVQIFINPISGTVIDRIGYDLPMMFGLTVMFFSTLLFACGTSYGVLFFARSLQGVGSAFADTGGLAMVADRYTEEAERSKALGIALAFISFGCLVAPPFGGFLYEFCGKPVPFIILAFVCLFDGFLLLLIMRPMKHKEAEDGKEIPVATPMWRLLIDPHIACCAGALVSANICLAFLEPTISKWMNDTMNAEEWQQGLIWLPAFFPHVAGVVLTVKMARKYPEYQWLLAMVGLFLEGVSCFIIPFSQNYFVLMFPICIICFGIALVDTALLPTLGFIVDKKYTSVYGSVYAIADISYSAAYAFGPVAAGHIVETMGFTALNIIVAIISIGYAPIIYYLKDMHDYNKYEEPGTEENVLMGDPPTKEYQTYNLAEGKPVLNGAPGPGTQTEYYAQVEQEETNFNENITANPFRQPQGANPFRR
ncbi:vesicular acetylcholine transporter isoform X2 [Eurytemora carolleeae]|uniref:vesicular acetylcholine transporter isoform X1 n=1 Tax=Eurytemora carolleeae TaxID=1294199 RepID=UPI000C78ABB9|nr:vesicular acetylcholine transporter isoform X1 [Eurytemora carolleeae]XP_023345499.1 vesicular acetylcholine transporter isoform X2 [Eurytemora carolleeae]|eukprot:XP_023345498.1 vesicular acetylcholine transporter-like isoform X1 [Eurytemora affinis]